MTTPTAFFATCDLAAQVRGRSVPVDQRERTLRTGTGWVPANLAIDAFGHLVEPNPFGPHGDLRLRPAADTGVEVAATDGSPGVWLYLADQTLPDGTPWECCPRTFLADAVTDLRAAGYELHAAFEHEFAVRDAAPSAPFSFARMRGAEPFGSELVTLLRDAGLEPENWLPEYGDGQFEVTTHPTSALAAADRAVVLRELVRDLARRRGRSVTFAPLLEPDGIGNGVHVHFSLRTTSGEPVLYAQDRPGRLSEIGARFAAGVLAHASAVTAFTAPSATSFLRLTPHRWSTAGAYLGDGDRESLLRICPTPAASETPVADQYNLEFRAADATANPWLALGAVVRAGLAGLQGDYPPAQVWTDGRPPDGSAEPPALPGSLPEALDAVEADATARSWFASDLLATYVAVKRHEAESLAALDDDARCRRIADVY